MKKLLGVFLLFFPCFAWADLSGPVYLNDWQGNGVTSNLSSGTRNPLDFEYVFGGSVLDLRTRVWTLSNSTDSVTSFQGTSPWVTNITQFGGSNVATGTGVSGSGIPRVTVSSDSNVGRTWTLGNGTDSVTSFQGTSPWVTNISQFGGTSVSTGTGASGTGIPRVTVANDSKVIAWDGTNTTVVKGASTAPVATDPSLVVGLSPNGNQATSSNQTTIGSQTTKINDGTNTSAVKAASTAAATTDPSLVVQLSPNGNHATAALQTTGNASLTSIATTSNSTAVNTSTIASNQTNGSQKVQLTDAAGSLFQVTKIDTNNSTSTVLGANATFTGSAWTDVSNYSTLSVLVFTDQVSATNGLTIQYSTDGVNADDNDQYTIPASNGQQFSFPLAARYYRVIYTNGAVAQTAFRLQSKIHSTPIKPSSYRISMGIPNGEQDAEVVLNVNGRLPLTANSPAAVSVGVASTSVLASNSLRKGLVLVNTSLARMSCNFGGGSAVLNSGITLYPGGTYTMSEFDYSNTAVTCIASIAASNLSVQEYQ